MALRERAVNGTIVDADGIPINNGEVKFKPTEKLGYTSTHIVVDKEFSFYTDAAGYFSGTIWCDEDSLVAINYNVYFPIADNGSAQADHIGTFSLAYGDGSPINIAALLSASVPAPAPEDLLYSTIESLVIDEVAANAVPRLPNKDDVFMVTGMPTIGDLGERKTLYLAAASAGNNVVYTVPAGKRVIVNSVFYSNYGGSSVSCNLYSRISGVDHRFTLSTSAAASGGIGLHSGSWMFEAGESIVIGLSGGSINITIDVIEMSSSQIPKRILVNSFVIGDNTIYTCPVGKKAFLFSPEINFAFGFSALHAALCIINDSGGSITQSVHYKPNGQPKYQLQAATGGNGGRNSFASLPKYINAGDEIIYNTSSSAGTNQQIALLHYFEYDA